MVYMSLWSDMVVGERMCFETHVYIHIHMLLVPWRGSHAF